MTQRTISIDEQLTVGSLAEKLMIPVSQLISELMKNGIMATVNERIDFDTAQIIVEELGLEIELVQKEEDNSDVLETASNRKSNQKGLPRPPVVAVMGHVDHGKTSLLDAIRNADTTSGEAGGITQHISAYQITYNDRLVTFLDTPGHEAFAALREHGAFLTDVVVIVVAADDGVKPQTIEAIRFAKKAGVKIIVAINKIDKEGSNIPQLKQQLSEQGLIVEEWGGDTVIVEVSAKNKTGIDKLLDMVFLVSDVEELKAEVNVPGRGIVIEAHLEIGRGPIAICLVDEGSIKRGDFIVAGGTYAKVRNLETTTKEPIQIAKPSTPVLITGFKQLPKFGDEFQIVKDEKSARLKASKVQDTRKTDSSNQDIGGGELIRIINRSNKVTELPVIIKADVQGSLTSVLDSIKSLDTDEVAVRIVSSGVGAINENDVHIAKSSNAIIYGFNSNVPVNIKRLVNRDKIEIRLYSIIYELIDDVKGELTKLLAPEIVETKQGVLKIKAIFKTTKTELICGGEVIEGKLTYPSIAIITRKGKTIAEVEVTNLKKGPQNTQEVIVGEMCGVNLATKSKVEMLEEDEVQFIKRESITRKL